MKDFALIGAAGYVAPRHMMAIQETGNNLVAALDKHDSVGILDSYYPSAHFFTELERFDRHLEKLKRDGRPIDYLVICSPNYLHDAHIRYGLKYGCNVICEKPLVINPCNLEALQEIERESAGRVNCILQLRHYPSLVDLKKKIEAQPKRNWDVDLRYITARGKWYSQSWKGNINKSGGIATNIGIHLFDLLIWLFGDDYKVHITKKTDKKILGTTYFKKARVKWFLSIDAEDIPEQNKLLGLRAFRSLLINGEEKFFSAGFTDLHTVSYQSILKGKGFTLADAAPAIKMAHQIRQA